MIGAILGDIAGSWIEYSKPKDFQYENVELFNDKCFYTDDTIMNIATKYAIQNQIPFYKSYQDFGRKYPDKGYGNMFDNWLRFDYPEPYGSFGNGSAMRVTYIGEYFNDFKDVEYYARESAKCTHNHPEGIKGAICVAMCISMAKKDFSKKQIENYVRSLGYILYESLNEVRPISKYDVTCQGTIPIAIQCFLESNNYESCIRNVFSLNCDTDTVACIAGGIAESHYKTTGFDNDVLLKKFLDNYLLEMLFC